MGAAAAERGDPSARAGTTLEAGTAETGNGFAENLNWEIGSGARADPSRGTANLAEKTQTPRRAARAAV